MVVIPSIWWLYYYILEEPVKLVCVITVNLHISQDTYDFYELIARNYIRTQ
jgi:hypothetical protein